MESEEMLDKVLPVLESFGKYLDGNNVVLADIKKGRNRNRP